jgi:hypothetical protein
MERAADLARAAGAPGADRAPIDIQPDGPAEVLP